jgi:hypothetical protein
MNWQNLGLGVGLSFLLACGSKPGNGDDSPGDDTGTATDSGTSTDRDGDGSPTSEDCDDSDADVFPGAPELCDGVDNDCDTEIDEDGFAAFDDADGDGFGDDSTEEWVCEATENQVQIGGDCNDSDAAVYPGAAEICNGIDDDCDAATSESQTVNFVGTDGVLVDVSDVYASGTFTNPAQPIQTEDGTLQFCEGTYYLNLTVEADLSIEGMSQDATTVVLDGAGAGATILSLQPYGALSLVDLSITGGAGYDYSSNSYPLGGGLYYSTHDPNNSTYQMGTVNMDNVLIYGNTAKLAGGFAIMGADTTIKNSEIRENHADTGYGGFAFLDGTHQLVGVDVLDNTTDGFFGGGAIYAEYASYVHDFEDVRFIGNQSGNSVGALHLAMNMVNWSGTSAGSSSVIGNITTNPTGVTGALSLENAYLVVSNVDFGATGSNDENGPYDLVLVNADANYMAPDAASFSCSPALCGTENFYSMGGTGATTDPKNGKFRAQVILSNSSTTATLQEFGWSIGRVSSSSCKLNFRVASTKTPTNKNAAWDVLWSSKGNTILSYKENWSGPIGLVVEPNTYYALIIAVGACKNSTDEIELAYARSGQATNVGWGSAMAYGAGDDSDAAQITMTYTTSLAAPFDSEVSSVEIK